MSRPKILISCSDPVSFHHFYLRPVLSQYFDIVDFESTTISNLKEYTVITNIMSSTQWWQPLVEQGVTLVYDGLWEHHIHKIFAQSIIGPARVLSCKYFFWINEYFVNLNLKYQNYHPQRQIIYDALLPINKTKPHRAQLLQKLGQCLDRILYSQVDHGRCLPNDQDLSQGMFQRFFNPEWYNYTAYTIVAESIVEQDYEMHITEKVFKPMAYYHPFVVWGQPGCLQYLHELGFETFENLFDESYDQELDQDRRLEKIVDNIVNFNLVDYDTLTKQKLEHNHNLFYNQEKVSAMVQQGIVNPILEYAETR